ncbi:hypothetical protein [Hydrogenophaga sp. 5NK40-0174]|uniref:hypothetical protein n=1 Tax=Hydrogenophaga sp. 5NK40-0174 TaxID=3127649 RepID=UPI00310C1436
MSYSVRLYTPEGATAAQQQAAERLFRQTLDAALGSPEMVLPVYQAYQRLAGIYGEQPDMELLSVDERTVFEHWQAAEAAAMEAVFGPHRHLDEGGFSIEPA